MNTICFSPTQCSSTMTRRKRKKKRNLKSQKRIRKKMKTNNPHTQSCNELFINLFLPCQYRKPLPIAKPVTTQLHPQTERRLHPDLHVVFGYKFLPTYTNQSPAGGRHWIFLIDVTCYIHLAIVIR